MSFKIIWTKTDEVPALASYFLLPIFKSFTKGTGIEFQEKDISLAGRILATFTDFLREDQRVPDHLTELGELTQHPHANLVVICFRFFLWV